LQFGGYVLEGVAAPVKGPMDTEAVIVWNYASTGEHSLDWRAVEILVETREIEDVEGLLDRLYVIKNHAKGKGE
jgi:hypothetical protein